MATSPPFDGDDQLGGLRWIHWTTIGRSESSADFRRLRDPRAEQRLGWHAKRHARYSNTISVCTTKRVARISAINPGMLSASIAIML